jgi:phosphoglycolate phosphatase-like HAD superfamily hydrolase
MRLVLFDIDGTILLTDGAGRRAIGRALIDLAGTSGPVGDHRFDGKTDPQIVRELLSLAGHPDAEMPARIQAVCDRYLELLELELASPSQETRVMTGVRELLDELARQEAAGQVLVGLLTGNLERGAALKLRSAGIDPSRFAVGAYGSDAAHRPELPAIARRRAESLTGRSIAGPDVVVIGDTPDDVACARPIGARTVAVATGRYDVTILAAAGATHVFADLSDTAAVLDALLA